MGVRYRSTVAMMVVLPLALAACAGGETVATQGEAEAEVVNAAAGEGVADGEGTDEDGADDDEGGDTRGDDAPPATAAPPETSSTTKARETSTATEPDPHSGLYLVNTLEGASGAAETS